MKQHVSYKQWCKIIDITNDDTIGAMFELLNFTYNFCSELGLVERVKSGGKYDRIYLTPLGVEVNNIFSLDLQAKKNRLNLNFKYLE